MSFNEKIRGKLEEIDPMVFYGRAGKLDETVLWNYIVFFRDKRNSSENRTSHTVTFHDGQSYGRMRFRKDWKKR